MKISIFIFTLFVVFMFIIFNIVLEFSSTFSKKIKLYTNNLYPLFLKSNEIISLIITFYFCFVLFFSKIYLKKTIFASMLICYLKNYEFFIMTQVPLIVPLKYHSSISGTVKGQPKKSVSLSKPHLSKCCLYLFLISLSIEENLKNTFIMTSSYL